MGDSGALQVRDLRYSRLESLRYELALFAGGEFDAVVTVEEGLHFRDVIS